MAALTSAVRGTSVLNRKESAGTCWLAVTAGEFFIGLFQYRRNAVGFWQRHDRKYRHRDGGSMLRPPFQADIPAQVSNFLACAAVASRYRKPSEPIALELIEFIGDRASVGRSSYTYDGCDVLRRLRVAKQQLEDVGQSLRIYHHDKWSGVEA